VRIGRVTPITPTALVALALPGDAAAAKTEAEIGAAVGELLRYALQRKLPTTLACDRLLSGEGLAGTLDALVENRVVSRREEDGARVYAVAPDQELTAAYYRNTIAHFFVNGAIAELALAGAAERRGPGAAGALWEEALRLRALLRFEFFFPEEGAYPGELRSELVLREPAWEARLGPEGDGATGLLGELRPHLASRVLRPFVESDLVAADVLGAWESGTPFDERGFLAACLRAGHAHLDEGRIRCRSAVSTVNCQTALRLLEARGLLAMDAPDLPDRRAAFAQEVRATLRRLDLVEQLQGRGTRP
jgi:glycerol-3-phosphate O-acyltransferase